ncbi:hypothetical protein Tco_0007306 [Tanacetum coccineum]
MVAYLQKYEGSEGFPQIVDLLTASHIRDFIKQETEVPQPSSPTQTHVADEAASTCVDYRGWKGYAQSVTGL